MHTFKTGDTTIHYNSDLSGSLIIRSAQREIEVEAVDISRFLAYWASEYGESNDTVAVKFLKPYITEAGNLENSNVPNSPMEWVEYEAGNDTVVLDGNFTVEQLEEIVRFMKAQRDKAA